jgi:hypothetical protein
MTTKTQTLGPYGFLISEANSHRSRDSITIASGQGELAVGTVLARESGGEYVAVDPDASDDTETAVAILGYPVDATSAAVIVSAITRDAEVRAADLVWPDDSNIEALGTVALAAAGIITR